MACKDLISFLDSKIRQINPVIKRKISERIKEFSSFIEKDTKFWFSELCFCILTANFTAEGGIKIQEKLDFFNLDLVDLKKSLRLLGHRFPNKRAEFIFQAKKFYNIKEIILKLDVFEKRSWLVNNVKGIGWKEASHFLRNVGFFDYSILDRHIISFLKSYNCISKDIFNSFSKKNYLLIEEKFLDISKSLDIFPGVLDLYIWYFETGTVLK